MRTIPILLTGGTGTLGRLVLARLRGGGRPVRVLSRRRRASEDGVEWVAGDLSTGEGIESAVRDVETIVHCAGSASGDDVKAARLAGAATRAGVSHIVSISVVGADRVPLAGTLDRAMFAYYGSKLGAERAIEGSGVPWTTLRATQFHELLLSVVRGMSKLPVIPVPSGFRFQPVAADEVASRLVELAREAPSGLVPDFAGPRVYGMDEALRAYLRASGKRRVIVPLRLPGRAAAALRAGANLAPERAVGRTTWEQFLADRVTRAPATMRDADVPRRP